MKLIGFKKDFDITPSFIMPIFNENDSYFCQEVTNDNLIDSFNLIDPREVNTLLEIDCEFVTKVGNKAIFAFIKKNGKVIFGDKKSLSESLKLNIKLFEDEKFVYLEVLDFIGDYNEMSRQLNKMISTTDNEIMIEWAKLELKDVKRKQKMKVVKSDNNKLAFNPPSAEVCSKIISSAQQLTNKAIKNNGFIHNISENASYKSKSTLVPRNRKLKKTKM